MGWMARTWQTAAFFAFIALLLVAMSVWEWLSPGGAPRRGVLALFGPPLWGATAVSVVIAVSVFRWG